MKIEVPLHPLWLASWHKLSEKAHGPCPDRQNTAKRPCQKTLVPWPTKHIRLKTKCVSLQSQTTNTWKNNSHKMHQVANRRAHHTHNLSAMHRLSRSARFWNSLFQNRGKSRRQLDSWFSHSYQHASQQILIHPNQIKLAMKYSHHHTHFKSYFITLKNYSF